MTRGKSRNIDAGLVGLVALAVGVVILSGFALARGHEPSGAPAAPPVAAPTEAAEPAVPAQPPVPVARPARGALRVVFAGDSLTGSYFATTEDKGFRPLLVQRWAAGGTVEPVGLGVPHGRLSEVEAGTEIPSKAHLAIIEVGTNDYGRTPVAEFRRQYDSLLARVAAESPGVVFVCAGLWEPVGDASGGVAAAEYDRHIRESCEAHGGRYVDLAPIFSAPGTRGPAGVDTETGESDDFHPNDLGHAQIADAIAAAVTIQ